MSAACPSVVGQGVVRGVLGAVDCQTREFAQAGYLALTGAGSPFQTGLTVLLTIYVALLGYRMLFATGGVRLADATGVGLRIGVVLALVSSWAAFQTVVFDLAARAPKEIAAIASTPLMGQGSGLTRDPVGGLQTAYDQLALSAQAFGRAAGPVTTAFSSPEAAAAEALTGAANALFLGGAGLIAVATLAVGVLTAVGPVFIALLLIPATRGVFAGWVRALAAAALMPLGGWILNLMMLVVLEPWLVALADQRHAMALDAGTAMGAAAVVFVFVAAQVVMAGAAGVIAFSFRLERRSSSARPLARMEIARPEAAPQAASRVQRLAYDLRRDQGLIAAGGSPRLAVVRLAPAASARGRPTGAPSRLGDVYRRPAVRSRGPGA